MIFDYYDHYHECRHPTDGFNDMCDSQMIFPLMIDLIEEVMDRDIQYHLDLLAAEVSK